MSPSEDAAVKHVEDDSSNNNYNDPEDKTFSDSVARPSLSVHLIRHAESSNNEVYRNAKYIYRGGTQNFDEEGWNQYVETHRKADPTLSAKGYCQADHLAKHFLIPHLENQASHPVRIITSPMRRTLETIKPTLEGLHKNLKASSGKQPKVHIIVCSFYHESEGCHLKDEPEEGMNPAQIRELLKDCVVSDDDLEFVGFPDPERGWYVQGKGAETRAESEVRAAKFYLWFCEHLDGQLLKAVSDHDLFDAGVQIEGEELEDEHDKHAQRIRRRRTTLVIGHGDFMSLVMKRLIAGYGHSVETEGISHRSAFAHFNTGISEFEYFGHGRYLVMGSNQTPHFQPSQYRELRSGGSLKDGWSYIMPADKFVLNAEVSVAFSDELEDHVREQATALKSLYLSSQASQSLRAASADLEVEEEEGGEKKELQFVVKRGLQVVGVACYSEETGQLVDVAIRPSAGEDRIGETLMQAVRKHARKLGRSGSMVVFPRSGENKSLFESMGFSEIEDDEDDKMAAIIE